MPKSCNLKSQQKIFNLYLNSAASCCRAYSSSLENRSINSVIEHWREEARLLDQGIEVDNCETCWKDERQNKLSYRQIYEFEEKTNLVELVISNLCNQMCSYCSPKYSSTWEQSIIDHGNFKNISATNQENLSLPKIVGSLDRLKEIEQYVHSCENNSVQLKLLGGEPLMQGNSLKKLLEFNQEKIKQLIIVTNLNPPKRKFLEWILSNFDCDRLLLQVSLDTTPEFNHVPRAGFDSGIFQQNLELLIRHNVKFKFSSTVSAVSIFDLPNYLEWVNRNQFQAKFFRLNNPNCLDPELVPLEFRKNILDDISVEPPKLVQDILMIDAPLNDIKLYEQYNYISQYFERIQPSGLSVSNNNFNQYWNWLRERFAK